MAYVRKIFTGGSARKLPRSGSISGRTGQATQLNPWWPDNICEKIEKIVWTVYCLGEVGEDWHMFVSYDSQGGFSTRTASNLIRASLEFTSESVRLLSLPNAIREETVRQP